MCKTYEGVPPARRSRIFSCKTAISASRTRPLVPRAIKATTSCVMHSWAFRSWAASCWAKRVCSAKAHPTQVSNRRKAWLVGPGNLMMQAAHSQQRCKHNAYTVATIPYPKAEPHTLDKLLRQCVHGCIHGSALCVRSQYKAGAHYQSPVSTYACYIA